MPHISPPLRFELGMSGRWLMTPAVCVMLLPAADQSAVRIKIRKNNRCLPFYYVCPFPRVWWLVFRDWCACWCGGNARYSSLSCGCMLAVKEHKSFEILSGKLSPKCFPFFSRLADENSSFWHMAVCNNINNN